MTPEKLTEITTNIKNSGDVVLNKFRNTEQIILANVNVNKALADIQFELDTTYAQICTRPENKDKPTAGINRIYKSETAELHRLKTIARGFKNTLRNMEYGSYK
jgi:hypothetical protein